MTTTLQKVRAKIIEAVPEIRQVKGSYKGVENAVERPITLADVLRAIGKLGNETIAVRECGTFMVYGDEWRAVNPIVQWNLSLPLDEQEPEVIGFIGKVLGV